MQLEGLFKKLSSFYQTLKPSQQRALLASLVVAIGAIGFWSVFFSRGPLMVPLFSNLETYDAAQIVNYLEDQGIQYKLSNEGRTILVPESDVYRLRLSLASEGIPRGTVGFELLDRTNFTATDLDKRINYVRALQGELARTISQIPEVEAARVHIVVPEPSVFVAERKPTTAAVFLKMRPLKSLQPEQVKAVVNLVSKSVEGLKPEDVVVVDDHGRTLSEGLAFGSQNEIGVAALNRLELQQAFTSRLESGLKKMLEAVFGPGNVATMVSAELNLDKQVVEKDLFSPNPDGSSITRSVRELEEYFRGEGAPAGGVPGVESNTIPVYPATTSGGPSEYQKREVTRNYEVNQIRESTTVAPGAVKRLSVAVVINRELKPEEQRVVEAAVSSAIGVDPLRQDQVTVVGTEFDTTVAKEMKKYFEAEQLSRRRELVYRFAAWAVAVALLGVALVVIVRSVRRVGAIRAPAPRMPEVAVGAEEMAAAVEELPPEELEKRRIREEVERLARQKPATVAQIISAWLVEE